jgi:hypothetical protein
LFTFRQDDKLESRIKFKIQDIIDAYNKEWRFVVAEVKTRIHDSEGFRKIYVPKDQILTEDQVFPSGRNSNFNNEKKKGDGQTYFYRAKSPKNKETEEGEKQEVKGKANKMANLLSCLQADE